MVDKPNIKSWLRPVSCLYGIGVWFRNKFFDWGIYRSEEFPVAVISVGNLAVGGTGKTPHTEFLIAALSKRYRVAVLSRGYKRKSSGYLLSGEDTTERMIGDEPFQIHRKFPHIPVAVDANRRRGIKNLLELPEERRPEVILLDDAFQHRHVKPSFSILLTDSSRLYCEDALLPAGQLREPKKNADRANMVIVTKCPSDYKPIDYRVIEKYLSLFPYQDLYFTSFEYKGLLPVFPEDSPIKKESIERLKKENYSILLVTGIANPTPMITYLEGYANTLEVLTYPDHHDFSRKDIAEIERKFNNLPGENKIIITTEKDSVRLAEGKSIPEQIKSALCYLPIEVVFNNDQESSFIQKIYNHVENVKRNRFLA